MRIRRSAAITAAGAALMLVAVLGGCASNAAPAATTTEVEVAAAWLDGGRMIGIVTEGSSTCVPVAGEVTAAGNTITVTFEDAATDQICTADIAPRVTLASVPEGVDPTKDITLHVSGDGIAGSASIPGVAGLAAGGATDYAPSAGWTGVDGQFVLLTWGSSSCAPVVQSLTAAETTVTMTFENPAPDRMCTLDMAPRAIVAEVDGLQVVADVQLTLTGDSFDGATLPIYGAA